MGRDVGVRQVVGRDHRDAPRLEDRHAGQLVAIAGEVFTVDDLLGLLQDVELLGTDDQHHVLGLRRNVLLLHRNQRVSDGLIQSSRIGRIRRGSEGFDVTTSVAFGLVASDVRVGGVRQSGNLDARDHERLIGELADLLALLLTDLLTHVKVVLEGFQQREDVASQNHRVDHEVQLAERDQRAIRRDTRLQGLQLRLTDGIVGQRVGADDAAALDVRVELRGTGEGALHDAGELRDVQCVERTRLVLLVRAHRGNGKQRHVLLLEMDHLRFAYFLRRAAYSGDPSRR